MLGNQVELLLALVAEWSKTLEMQIQVTSGHLGPRFESLSGHMYANPSILLSL